MYCLAPPGLPELNHLPFKRDSTGSKTTTDAAHGTMVVPAFSMSLNSEEQNEINKLKADFGFLNHDHPLVTQVNKVLRGVYPRMSKSLFPRIRVLASTGFGIYSAVFSDRTIVISPELISFIKYKEELIF
ncbi:MAG: hypothetical protein GF384_07920, partial [Elusimicrobia bacterium]|nr:hypothetical protein [Elusimicrobiota bacterium]